MAHRHIPILIEPLTAQTLLDWYMELCKLGLMWNPDDDPAQIVDDNRRNTFTVAECMYLQSVRDKIHDIFLDPCEIAMYAIGCHDAGLPAIAVEGMGDPKAVRMAAVKTPHQLMLWYIRMYHPGTRRTAHCVASGTHPLAAIASLRNMLVKGNEYQVDNQREICAVPVPVCIQLQ